MLLRFAQRGIAGDDILAGWPSPSCGTSRPSGETVNLAVAGPLGPETIAEIESRHVLGTGDWVGRRGVPLHASAFGKVFLACGAMHLPPGELRRRTAHDHRPRTLEAELARARARLRDGGRRARARAGGGRRTRARRRRRRVAALAISGPTLRLTGERIDALGASARRAGDEFSARLGKPPATEGAA